MPNKNYEKGRRKEYKIVNDLKKKGYIIAQRTAGSHSPIDVFAINREKKIIKFVQAKPDSMSEKEKEKIKENLDYLNGLWCVTFEVI